MASTISDIRRALRERVAQTGIRARLEPPPDEVGNELPLAYINLVSGSYAATFGGRPLSGEIIVTVIVQSGENDEGWYALDKYLSSEGAESIVQAIEEDGNLGLSDVSVGVMGFRNAGFRDIAGGVWAAEIVVNYAKAS